MLGTGGAAGGEAGDGGGTRTRTAPSYPRRRMASIGSPSVVEPAVRDTRRYQRSVGTVGTVGTVTLKSQVVFIPGLRMP